MKNLNKEQNEAIMKFLKGVYVPVKETVRGFKAIIEGEMDDYPEAAFYNVGTLDDAIAKAETLK